MLPDRRFRPEPMSATEAIAWLQSHRYIWYQAPMDHSPRRVYCTSKLKTWKRNPARFSVGVEVNTGCGENLRFRVDETHLDRLRLPFDLWHHGITASVSHVNYIGEPRAIVVHQSNGYHLPMRSLKEAVTFAKRQALELTVCKRFRSGARVRVLVPAHAPISGEQNF